MIQNEEIEHAGGPLYTRAISNLIKGLNTGPQDDQTDYYQYKNDPVGFCQRYFKEDYTKDVKQLMESVRDNYITIAKSANGVGKTHAAARIGAWAYKCHRNSQVYTAAAPPEENLKRLLWGEIGDVITRYSQVFSDSKASLASLSLTAKTRPRHFLVGVTIPITGSEKEREARFSGKHAPYILFIIDEGDAVPDEVYNGIESCMSGGEARLLIMFNPRAEQGPVHAMERSGRANVVTMKAFSHPNVRTGKDIIPGAVTQRRTVIRLHEWSRPATEREIRRHKEVPNRDIFRVPLFLNGVRHVADNKEKLPKLKGGEYRVVTDHRISYMVLANYPSVSISQLVKPEWIDRANYNWKKHVERYGEIAPLGTRAECGLDVAESEVGDSSVFTRKYDWWVAPQDVWGGVDPVRSGEIAAELFKAGSAISCNVDANGIGAGTGPVMRRMGCRAADIKVQSKPDPRCLTKALQEVGEFKLIRDLMLWLCREWLRLNPKAALPPCEVLREEILATTYCTIRGRLVVEPTDSISKKLEDKRSPDRFMSLALIFAPPSQRGKKSGSTNYLSGGIYDTGESKSKMRGGSDNVVVVRSSAGIYDRGNAPGTRSGSSGLRAGSRRLELV